MCNDTDYIATLTPNTLSLQKFLEAHKPKDIEVIEISKVLEIIDKIQ